MLVAWATTGSDFTGLYSLRPALRTPPSSRGLDRNASGSRGPAAGQDKERGYFIIWLSGYIVLSKEAGIDENGIDIHALLVQSQIRALRSWGDGCSDSSLCQAYESYYHLVVLDQTTGQDGLYSRNRVWHPTPLGVARQHPLVAATSMRSCEITQDLATQPRAFCHSCCQKQFVPNACTSWHPQLWLLFVIS